MPNELKLVTSQLTQSRDSDEWSRRTVETHVATETIRDNFRVFLDQVKDVFFQTLPETESFLLDEIQLTADVSADGDIRLMNSGMQQDHCGIRLTLRRRRSEDTADIQELHLNTPHDPLNHAGPSGSDPVEISGADGDRIKIDVDGKVNPTPGPLSVTIT